MHFILSEQITHNFCSLSLSSWSCSSGTSGVTEGGGGSPKLGLYHFQRANSPIIRVTSPPGRKAEKMEWKKERRVEVRVRKGRERW